MANACLLMWLEAPLQAWGHDSKFGRRDSLDFPTKSGVLGLICCARGAGGEEVEWLKAWADEDMQVAAYVPQDHLGKPQARLPLLQDFQMVGSGYDKKDPWQSLHIPNTSNGKPADNVSGAKLTYRYYLQDMAFAVILSAPIELIREAAKALRNPVWDIYLGRKNCAPTEFVYQGVYESVLEAEEAASRLAEDKKLSLSFKVIQGEGDGNVFAINDIPTRFGRHKQYRDRVVTVIKD